MPKPCLLMMMMFLLVSNATANEIYLIPTLHQLHEEVTNYSFDDLQQLLKEIQPDVLLVELTNKDIETDREQQNKVEYTRVVLPFARENDVPMVALEPDEPLYSVIIGKMRKNHQRAALEDSLDLDIFGQYLDLFYAQFSNNLIQSGADLASDKFDVLCKIKHEFQSVIYGEIETEVWDMWNTNFLETILKSNAAHKESKIVVLVGAEHHYWLKEKLLENELSLSTLPFK